MIPLGTGLFKTLYDSKKHNESLKLMQEKKERSQFIESNKNGFKDLAPNLYLNGNKENIVEEKLMRSSNILNKSEIQTKLDFNLIEFIN